MNVPTTRIRLATALACTLVCLSVRATDELRFSEIEERLTSIEEQLASEAGVEHATYFGDDGADVCAGAPEDCYGCYENRRFGRTYTAVELYWARLHMSESVAGKLSETHEVSPRVVLGYEGAQGLGGRIRYWNYSRATRLLGDNDDIRFELDVTDLEGTSHIRLRRTDLKLAGGLRIADVESVDVDNEIAEIHMCGLTMAADARTRFGRLFKNRLAAVYGGRISLLGGDWDGSLEHDFIDRSRDDNLIVHELYSGLEYNHDFSRGDFFTRVVWEMQMWQTDALERGDSFGFVGPAWHLGASF